MAAYVEFLQKIRSRRFELVLDLQRHIKSGFTSWATGAKTRIGFNPKNAKEFNWIFNNEYIPRADDSLAKIDHYQKFGDLLGLPEPERLDFGFQFTKCEEDKVDLLLSECRARLAPDADFSWDKSVAFIIGAAWESKQWFPDYYARLVSELFNRWGLFSILVGHTGERRLADEIYKCLDIGEPSEGRVHTQRYAAMDLVGKLSLKELGSLFSKLRFAIGSDTGPTHLAAAVGLPVISLWGATSHYRSAPYGSEHLVLAASVDCSPCYLRQCPGLGRICLRKITPEVVITQAELLLTNHSTRSEIKAHS